MFITRVQATPSQQIQHLSIPKNATILGMYVEESEIAIVYQAAQSKVSKWKLVAYALPVILDKPVTSNYLYVEGWLFVLYPPEYETPDPQPGVAAKAQPAKRV